MVTGHPFRRSALPIAILLLAFALRLMPWGSNRFLEDEALYAYWGLQIATGTDPMLDEEPVDKPPLHPYTLALSFLLWPMGGTDRQLEGAARLPSLFASITSIALVYSLGRALFNSEPVGLLAALLLALSPFDILFASTAFTDPLLTVLVLAALVAAAKDHLGSAGLLLGLATATKQQGIFFLPLVVAVAALRPSEHSGFDERPRSRRARLPLTWLAQMWSKRWMRFAVGFAIVAAGALVWDAARVQRPGFLEQSLISYGGLGPAQPGALGPRALEWLKLAGSFWVSPWFSGLMLGTILFWFLGGWVGWWSGASRIDLALAAFTTGFLLLHWLVGFQVWGRYLLGLVPLVALLAGRAFVALGSVVRSTTWQRVYAISLGALLVTSLTGPAIRAARSELPLGGDHGAYDGIDHLAAYMRSQVPPGSVLYHFWLGYHYRFYLFGEPLRLHWYPDLEDLSHDAYVYRREPRYIAFPSWRDNTSAEKALAETGVHLELVYETTRRDGSVSFRLYRMEGP
jgi:hypothetical protein